MGPDKKFGIVEVTEIQKDSSKFNTRITIHEHISPNIHGHKRIDLPGHWKKGLLQTQYVVVLVNGEGRL